MSPDKLWASEVYGEREDESHRKVGDGVPAPEQELYFGLWNELGSESVFVHKMDQLFTARFSLAPRPP